MLKKDAFFASLLLLLISPSAQASLCMSTNTNGVLSFTAKRYEDTGWYEVKNYVGTIGIKPVHVSLQTFDDINSGEKAQWRVDGSYYYDAHRIPIPLQGQRQPDGSMVLCEARLPRLFYEDLKVPAVSKAHPVPCPISLKITADSATGEWNNGKKKLSIVMRQVGSLNNTGTDPFTPPLVGVVEIPMWFHTKKHMLLGVYKPSENCDYETSGNCQERCPVSMGHLRLVNIATGRIDNEIELDSNAGTVMTSIYENVSGSLKARHVSVVYQDAKMGYDEDVEIMPRTVKRK
jgi:hypothetical protein